MLKRALVVVVGLLMLGAAGGQSEPLDESFRGRIPDRPSRAYAEFTDSRHAAAALLETTHAGTDWYGGVWFAEDEHGQPTFFLAAVGGRRNVPDASLRPIDDAGARIVNVQHSLKALEAEQRRLMKAREPLGFRFATFVDVMENRVGIRPFGEPLSASESESVGVNSEIHNVGEPMLVAEAVDLRGGQTISYPGGGACTAGFTVKTASPSYATLTAGHCPNSGASQLIPIGNATQVKTWGIADRQFHPFLNVQPLATPSRTLTNGVTIVGSKTTFKGEMLCKIGHNTGVNCGQVITTSYEYYVGMPYFIVSAQVSDRGDSGGPVYSFLTNKAVGIVTACMYPAENDPCVGAFATVSTKVQNALQGTGYSLYLG